MGLESVPVSQKQALAMPSRPAPTPPVQKAPDVATVSRPTAVKSAPALLHSIATLPAPSGPKLELLTAMDVNEVRGCPRCRLCQTRTQTVFGEGDPDAKIFFIGEGPGETEDKTGRPFVGRAGQLLDRMIGGMGLKREQVYIANIVKCRPPANRAPAPDEIGACTPFLDRQLEIVRPRVIITLGLPATRHMTGLNLSMGKMRGVWHEWRGIKLMPTFHPSYVLRSYTQTVRAAVWSDLQQVMDELGMQRPGKSLSET